MGIPFDGVLMTRMQLRRARRSASVKMKTAIDAALADEDFCTEQTRQAMHQCGLPTDDDAKGLPSGWLQQLLKFLVDNLPAILALIMALFGA